MRLHTRVPLFAFGVGLLSVGLILTALTAAGAAEKKERERKLGSITRPEFDPSAEQVDLFAGMEDGTLESWVIPENEHYGFAFVENKTDKPITVKLPDAVVMVHNLKQFGGQQGGFGGGGQGGFGGQQGGFGGGQGGGQQQGGGGFGGQQGGQGGFGGGQGGFGGGQGGGGGQGFFSIPPQRRVRLNMYTVCLNHGKETPNKLNRYHLIPMENYTQNETLQELLRLVATGKISPSICQAATWHLTDGLSFEQMAAKKRFIVGAATPYFTHADLVAAQQLLVLAHNGAQERKKNAGEPQPQTPQPSLSPENVRSKTN